MFLHDKYSPKNIDDLYFHANIFNRLVRMSKDNAIPHIILYGPPGVGKKTLSRMLLENIYDKSINDTQETNYIVNGSGNATTNISIKQSAYHVVIDPNNNNFDRYLIQDIVKAYAKRIPMDVFHVSKNFRTVMINNVDNLSYYAQMSLRRTMEKYSNTCRFLMICNAISKLIEPLKSRCVCIRIPAPNNMEITGTLLHICYFEKYNLDLQTLLNISMIADGNVKIAIWLLDCAIRKISLVTTYDMTITKIVSLIWEKDLRNLPDIHVLLYNIFITNIPGTKIIGDITLKLCDKKINEQTKMKILDIAVKFDHYLTLGRREITHLNGFVNNVILILKEESL